MLWNNVSDERLDELRKAETSKVDGIPKIDVSHQCLWNLILSASRPFATLGPAGSQQIGGSCNLLQASMSTPRNDSAESRSSKPLADMDRDSLWISRHTLDS